MSCSLLLLYLFHLPNHCVHFCVSIVFNNNFELFSIFSVSMLIVDNLISNMLNWEWIVSSSLWLFCQCKQNGRFLEDDNNKRKQNLCANGKSFVVYTKWSSYNKFYHIINISNEYVLFYSLESSKTVFDNAKCSLAASWITKTLYNRLSRSKQWWHTYFLSLRGRVFKSSLIRLDWGRVHSCKTKPYC